MTFGSFLTVAEQLARNERNYSTPTVRRLVKPIEESAAKLAAPLMKWTERVGAVGYASMLDAHSATVGPAIRRTSHIDAGGWPDRAKSPIATSRK